MRHTPSIRAVAFLAMFTACGSRVPPVKESAGADGALVDVEGGDGASANPDQNADSADASSLGTSDDASWPIGSVRSCGPPATPGSSACPAALCGNGHIDDCSSAYVDASGVVEQCDGTDLGSQTCTGLGYARGTLNCTANCLYDTSGCDSCANGPRTARCARPDLGGASVLSYRLALDASDSEIGLAWSEVDTGLHFTRLSPDSTLLSDTACFGGAVQGGERGELSIAATATGWLIAEMDRDARISLFYFDKNGVLRNTRSLPVPNLAGGSLVPRRGGGPLMTWLTLPSPPLGTLHAQRLTDDGTPVDPEVSATEIGDTTGVFVGDGFELAAFQNFGGGPYVLPIHFFHVGLDGTLRSDAVTSPVVTRTPIAIAWSGSEVRLVYLGCVPDASATCSAGMYSLLSITAGGATVASPSTFSIPSVESIVAIGSDTFVFDGRDLYGVNSSGTPLSTTEPVVRSPAFAAGIVGGGTARMVAMGSDAVIAWIASGRIVLANVRLTQ